VDRLKQMGTVYEGEAGFFPPPKVAAVAAPTLFDECE
jgi:hypothetical protein